MGNQGGAWLHSPPLLSPLPQLHVVCAVRASYTWLAICPRSTDMAASFFASSFASLTPPLPLHSETR